MVVRAIYAVAMVAKASAVDRKKSVPQRNRGSGLYRRSSVSICSRAIGSHKINQFSNRPPNRQIIGLWLLRRAIEAAMEDSVIYSAFSVTKCQKTLSGKSRQKVALTTFPRQIMLFLSGSLGALRKAFLYISTKRGIGPGVGSYRWWAQCCHSSYVWQCDERRFRQRRFLIT